MEVMGIKDIMEELGVSREYARWLVTLEGCPVLPRMKGQTIRVLRKPFYKWLEAQTWR